MSGNQVRAVVTLVAVLSWSVVMTALGHAAMVVPLLGLLVQLALVVQQIIQALTRSPGCEAALPPPPGQDEGQAAT